jgi:phosphoribosyl 1,2-cyclic phosphodiesterase
VRVTLWGTRGSLASAGPDTIRYGGNTVCVEVRGSSGACLILDAGTGIRRLGAALEPAIKRVDVLLTHLHMDHIQGLGFFAPLFRTDLDLHLWGPPSTTQDLRGRLSRYLSPPLFPVHLRDLRHGLTIHDVPLGRFEIEGLELRAALVCHPGPTVGYRITDRNKALAYLPDHEPALGARTFPQEPEWTSGFALAAGADLLIHDAQYTEAEYPAHVGWGHSSIQHALAFAAAAGVRRLVPCHHDPSHTDDLLDVLLDEMRGLSDSVQVLPGKEGARFDV